MPRSEARQRCFGDRLTKHNAGILATDLQRVAVLPSDSRGGVGGVPERGRVGTALAVKQRATG